MTELTNRQFAAKNEEFIKACFVASSIESKKGRKADSIMPTTRQASKYRNKKGLAYKLQGKQ